MRNENPMGEPGFQQPIFQAQIPDHLMKRWNSLDPVMQYLLKEQSIQSQQNRYIIKRLCDGDAAIGALDQDVAGLKKIRDLLTAKWSVIAFIALSILIPGALLALGVYLKSLFSK